MIPRILVTGRNGQLAKCIEKLDNKKFKFFFTDSLSLDIKNKEKINTFFKTNKIDWCINCAAYTAVDKAESDYENAYKINVEGVKYLAEACRENQTRLIHISTDFVFDGKQNTPYCETDQTHPINKYGETKRYGEREIFHILEAYFIIRTSWLYSEFGNNFLKTMLRLSKERSQLSIVGDQIGTPTYAIDLAKVILLIIENNSKDFGIYHFSNEGVASWYDFAKSIFDISEIDILLKNIKTKQFPTPAKRPHFSVLDKTKTSETFKIEIPYWRESLEKAIENLKNEK